MTSMAEVDYNDLYNNIKMELREEVDASSVASHDSYVVEESNEHPEDKAKKREEHLEEINQKVKKESQRIVLFRTILVLSMLSMGAALSVLTYHVLDSGFTEDAEDAFRSFANGIDDSFQVAVFEIFEANRALSQTIATSAREYRQDFPFFTVPYFEVKAYAARKQASFETVVFAPVVTGVQLEDFLKFTNSSRDWYDESKALYDELSPGEYRSAEPRTDPLPLTLWNRLSDGSMVPDMGSAIAVPSLQTSPPPPLGEVHQNVNLWSSEYYREVTLASLTLKDAVFSEFSEVFKGGKPEDKTREETLHPRSIAAQPIFNRLHTKESRGAIQGLKVVGYIYSAVDWDNYLVNLLPEGVNGIIVLLRNSCGQVYTYQLDGNKAIFLGEGNLHKGTQYDTWMKTVDFADNYFDPKLTSEQPGHCQIFLDVYPSAVFLQEYTSHLPMVFSITVAVLFVLMATLFSLYDISVRIRNHKVVDSAARTNAVVASLFPSSVRDRLIDEFNGDDKSENATAKSDIASFLRRSGTGDDTQLPIETRPLADFFPNTTVLFADIVGFTKFSSTREPWEVFTLLESLYGSFDRTASKQGIYKVETIGDCYVAATGLPDSRDDHAVAMAIFAKSILKRMSVLVQKLSTDLGPDTRDLTLRIGIHSGPVTAGVLRGERSRFQLFGDTMNTASRMESNSMPRRIQVSKETADLLVQGGKGSWLKEREDPIQAKGKGELRTFWLVSSSSSSQNGNDPARSSSHRSSSLSDTEDYDITTFHEDDEDTAVKEELSSRLFERLSV